MGVSEKEGRKGKRKGGEEKRYQDNGPIYDSR